MQSMENGGLVDKLYNKLASGKLCIILGALYFINQILIGWITHPLGADMLNVQITLDGAVFSKIVQGWDQDQLAAYYRHFYPDFLHPFLYALFLASAIATLSKPKHGPVISLFRFLFLLPFVAGTCDLLENCLHLYLVPRVPDIPYALVTISGAATNIKWFLACMCVGGVGYLGFRKILERKVLGKD